MYVHKDSIVIAIAREGREEAETWQTIPYDGVKLLKVLKSLATKGETLRVCYEAAPPDSGCAAAFAKRASIAWWSPLPWFRASPATA